MDVLSVPVDDFLRELSRAEYLHVLLNPLPVYGLAVAALALAGALLAHRRAAVVLALALVAFTSLSAWPTYGLGRSAYEVVNTTVDPEGQDWLNAHRQRAEKLIWTFYVLAAAAGLAAWIPLRWPKTALPLALLVLLGAVGVLIAGGWIAYAGGKIRHVEFRRGTQAPTGE